MKSKQLETILYSTVGVAVMFVLLGGFNVVSAAFKQRDGQGIAKRELHQRRGRRRQIMWTGFACRRQHQHDIGGFTERALKIDCHGDERDAKPPRIID